MALPNRILHPTDGTNQGQFGLREWGMVATTSVLWGSSYLWIAIGLESFAPGIVAWLRLAFAVVILTALSRVRTRIERADWAAVAVVGIVGNAGPALLFALAEQRVESAVVGMITGSTPLVTLVLAVLLGSRSLRRIHILGLGVGFVGILMMSLVNVSGEGASAPGVFFVFLAVLCYSVTSIVLGPLQQKYGGMAVILNAQVVAVIAMTPYAAVQIGESSFSWRSFVAVAILGLLGTGVARTTFANLIGRAGPARAGVVGYLVPVVAVILGVIILSESVSLIEVAGLAVVLAGAFMTSRPTQAARRVIADSHSGRVRTRDR